MFPISQGTYTSTIRGSQYNRFFLKYPLNQLIISEILFSLRFSPESICKLGGIFHFFSDEWVKLFI